MSPREDLSQYEGFLKAKIKLDKGSGFDVDPAEMNPNVKDFVRAMVAWALRDGRRAFFASFGLHKSCAQLETMRLIGKHRPCRRLIVLPLGVRQEFVLDALEYFSGDYAVSVQFIQSSEEVTSEEPIYLTNYESVREGKIDVTLFGAVSLDEADVLRSFGSKTFGEFLFGPMQQIPFRFVATATPSPNDLQELIAYAHFLGVMDIWESRTRFFKRNSENADDLTLHPHKVEEFWLWVASWALFVSKPSDLGFSDEGYVLPELDVRWHEVPTDHTTAEPTKLGQGKLLKDDAVGVVQASREKRISLEARVAKMLELRDEDPDAHRLIWHDLEDERRAIEAAIPTAVSVYGSQTDEKKEAAIIGFRNGEIAELAAKPVMLGGGCNFQRHCSWEIFLGIGFKFRDFIQAIHRLQRFGQKNTVRVDLIYSEAERGVREILEAKWRQHIELVATMTAIVKQFGLCGIAMAESLTRSMGTERKEASGQSWKLVCNDSILECNEMESDSVSMILTSIPFSTQYEYTPSYHDLGHTDDEAHFFEQMDFLTSNLLRILQPGRICAVHVKDRIVPGAMTGLKYPTVSPFHCHTLLHFLEHGFTFLGMVTIKTDVVRENNQTYRLGWTEQCKDGTVKGFGMPEYVLVFRKAPTEANNGYADNPVVKTKEEYSLARWQIDADGLWRSNGNTMISHEDFRGLNMKSVYRLYEERSLNCPYDFGAHVRLAEFLDKEGILPTDFSLIPVHSDHPEIWTDITRMRTLNSFQAAKGREKHICPLQIDIVDRLIERYTNPGETVFDPFCGIGTVPWRAIKLGRKGAGCELNAGYWADSVSYLKAAEAEMNVPTLFDFLEPETAGAVA